MAQYSRLEVVGVMQDTGMVPLFYHPEIALGKELLKACYEGGSRLLEFTALGDFDFEVLLELHKYAVRGLPRLILGVGSIANVTAASMFMQMGVNFILTPSLREDIAVVCNRKKVLWLSGSGSLT